MAFHFRLPVFLPIFLFPFLVQYSPSLTLYRSLARSLFSPYSPSLVSHSYSAFSWFLLLAFLPVFVLSLVFTVLFLSFFLSFSYSLLYPSSLYFPPLLHVFYSFSHFFSSPYFLVHIIIIYFFPSFVILPNVIPILPIQFSFVVVLFPNPSSCSSTPAIPSSCHASFFLSFPIFTILLLFVLSFYISFLLAILTFSSHFSSPSSCFFFTDDYSLVLVLIILSLSSYHSSTCSVNLVFL